MSSRVQFLTPVDAMEILESELIDNHTAIKTLNQFIFNSTNTFNLFKSNKLTPLDQLNLTLFKIKQLNPTCNAFINQSYNHDSLIQQAIKSTQRYASKTYFSQLDGITLAIKANFSSQFGTTHCGSNVLFNYQAPFNATVVNKLIHAGAIILIDKTNMDEFGMGSFNLNSQFGPCFQPDSKLISGGSSGGSAVAVQSGMVFAALGSDTGGSIRLPASYTGTFGFKGSYGSVSRFGLIPYAHSLDTVGILARSTCDIQLIFDILSGHDPFDMTSFTLPPAPTSDKNKIFKIGIPQEYNLKELSQSARNAWSCAVEYLESLGHLVMEVSLPSTHAALSAYYVLACAEVSSNLSKFDGIRFGLPHRAHLGKEALRRVMLGDYVLSASAVDTYYQQARNVREWVIHDFKSVFTSSVDVLVTPASLGSAPTMDHLSKLIDSNPYFAYINDMLTVPASLAGLPAMVVPMVIPSSHERVGVQVIAPFAQDHLVFQLARILERNDNCYSYQ